MDGGVDGGLHGGVGCSYWMISFSSPWIVARGGLEPRAPGEQEEEKVRGEGDLTERGLTVLIPQGCGGREVWPSEAIRY